MSNLNSVLIEGKVLDIVKVEDTVSFLLASRRQYHSFGEVKTEVTNVTVRAESALAKKIEHSLYEGANARVVGRLSFDGTAIIVAEHIEARPKGVEYYDQNEENPASGGSEEE